MKALATSTVVLIVLAIIVFAALTAFGIPPLQAGFDAIKSLVLRIFPQLAGVTGNTPETPLEQAIYASYLRCTEGCDAVLNSPYITDDSVLAQACGRNRDERLLMDLFDDLPGNKKVDKICDTVGPGFPIPLYIERSSRWPIKVNPNEHFELDRIALAADCMVDVQSPRGSIGWEDVIQNFISTFTGGGKWAFINSKDLIDKIPAANCVGRTEHVVFQSGTTKIETWVSTELRALHKFTIVAGGFSYCLIAPGIQTTECRVPTSKSIGDRRQRLLNEFPPTENLVLEVSYPQLITNRVNLIVYFLQNNEVRNEGKVLGPGEEKTFLSGKYKIKFSGLDGDVALLAITYNPP
jgi:hypothetical protein